MLINTKQAAELTGLSEYELRYGFKRGLYPALEIGRGSRRKSLRWDPDILQQAIRDAMHTRQAVSGNDFTFNLRGRDST